MAVRVDLGQSDVVSVAEPAYVAAVLDRMEVELGADAPLSADLAREAAIREGLKAVISGDVATVAGSHVISVRVTAAESGDDLVTLRETASDSTKVMDSIDRLSRQLRERLGESLGSIRNSASLAKATTSSLEALRRYSLALQAIDKGDNEKGIALLDEAIASDSTFGMAWRKLAAVDVDRREMAVTRAYELRDRMTERERYHAIGLYHIYVTDDLDAAVTAYSTLLDLYPEDSWALNNLGQAYDRRGQFDLSIVMYERAIAADPYSSPLAYTNLIFSLHLHRRDRLRLCGPRQARRGTAGAPVLRSLLCGSLDVRGGLRRSGSQAPTVAPERDAGTAAMGHEPAVGDRVPPRADRACGEAEA